MHNVLGPKAFEDPQKGKGDVNLIEMLVGYVVESIVQIIRTVEQSTAAQMAKMFRQTYE